MKSVLRKNVIVGTVLLITWLSGCTSMVGNGEASIPKSANDYQTLGLQRGCIGAWEDGMRTTGVSGSYEWWYFDSTLADGSTMVIVFYTKDMVNPDTALLPQVSLEIDRLDGTKIHKFVQLQRESFSASKDSCDVKIGTNTFRGDLHTYNIHVAIEEVTVDIQLVGDVPSWRPETGTIQFNSRDEHFFAWLPSVPHGTVRGSSTISGKSEIISGTGYHDHNWGNTTMLNLIHNWYWGRAQVGRYSVIASYITASDIYGNNQIPIFMLAKDGKILVDDSSKVSFHLEDVHINAKTGKPVANRLIYDYDDGIKHYRVTFKRRAELMEHPFIEQLKGFERLIAGLIDFDGAYLRFTGSVEVEKIEESVVVDISTENSAVWELMYFGHAPAATSRK